VSGPTPLAIAADMAARFERHGVRYVLGGSMASAVFGEPRSTLDIDFAADLSALTIEPWLADVRTEFGLDEAWARTEVARRGSFQMMQDTLRTGGPTGPSRSGHSHHPLG
jgi:hypothetical protein